MTILSPGSVMPIAPSIFLPVKPPSADFQYGYDAIANVTAPDGTVDAIISASITVKPSGSGELAVSQIDVQNTIISFFLSSGVAGRPYIVRLTFTTISAQTYEIDLGCLCDPLLAAFPIAPPPAFGFGASTVWP